jgi:hypothetical protein
MFTVSRDTVILLEAKSREGRTPSSILVSEHGLQADGYWLTDSIVPVVCAWPRGHVLVRWNLIPCFFFSLCHEVIPHLRVIPSRVQPFSHGQAEANCLVMEGGHRQCREKPAGRIVKSPTTSRDIPFGWICRHITASQLS